MSNQKATIHRSNARAIPVHHQNSKTFYKSDEPIRTNSDGNVDSVLPFLHKSARSFWFLMSNLLINCFKSSAHCCSLFKWSDRFIWQSSLIRRVCWWREWDIQTCHLETRLTPFNIILNSKLIPADNLTLVFRNKHHNGGNRSLPVKK